MSVPFHTSDNKNLTATIMNFKDWPWRCRSLLAQIDALEKNEHVAWRPKRIWRVNGRPVEVAITSFKCRETNRMRHGYIGRIMDERAVVVYETQQRVLSEDGGVHEERDRVLKQVFSDAYDFMMGR